MSEYRPKHDEVGMHKSILWEEAKGKLLAIVAAEGSRYGGATDDNGLMRYENIRKEFEAFFKEIEDKEYHI